MRTYSLKKTTRETSTSLDLNLDGARTTSIDTGVGFFDHMLATLAFHAGWDLDLRCCGDLHVDAHHTVEDSAGLLGEALGLALGERKGIVRFGSAYAPLDEALARTVVDLSGRPYATLNLNLQGTQIGILPTDLVEHALEVFAFRAGMTLHIDVLRGKNDHHRVEAAYKSLALALRQATSRNTDNALVSLKGDLA